MAEREGFEPPIDLRLCRISSAVHSTTLPPLREAWRAMASPSRSSFLIEHDLFGKPVSTFPDHARQHAQIAPCRVARGVLGHHPEKGKRVFGEARGPRKAAHSREGGNQAIEKNAVFRCKDWIPASAGMSGGENRPLFAVLLAVEREALAAATARRCGGRRTRRAVAARDRLRLRRRIGPLVAGAVGTEHRA